MNNFQLTGYIFHSFFHIIHSIAEGPDMHAIKSDPVIMNPDQGILSISMLTIT